MIEVTNDEFIKTIFGDDYPYAHVTSFPDDPSNLTNDRRGICWGGGYYHNTYIQPGTNQYYTISTFMGDDNNRSRRRKVLFRCTHVIVADDVVEKLPIANVMRLPHPTFKLETSPGSEQWGWVLNHPETDRAKVENLLDGLVDKGLAPSGKDPGMKGVTRYVRLPEGVNTKASRVLANHGFPPKCNMIEWNPEIRVSLQDLADPFGVDINAERREGRIDGASDIPDHPLLHSGLTIKEVRSDGRFDIQCPWVDEHTGAADDGAAIFTNDDGSIGFKCHHGACQHRTGKDLLEHIEEIKPGFIAGFDNWKIMRSFKTNISPDFVGSVHTETPMPDFLGVPVETNTAVESKPDQEAQMVSYQDLVDTLRRIPPQSEDATGAAYAILKAVDKLDHGSRLTWWNQVKDYMNWNKNDLQSILNQQRTQWYPKEAGSDFYEDHVFVADQNQFYNIKKSMFLTPDAFQNSFAHIDAEARMEALMNGRVRKVDRVDYAPGMPFIFNEGGVSYVNGWSGDIEKGVPGCVQRWLDHFDTLGWKENKKHMLQWMAFTLRHPERKINHIMILGGGEGNGKDFILYPLINAMRSDTTTIDGDELLRDFNEFLLGTKYLHINEADLGDRREAQMVHNRLKPIASAPPATLRVNQKGIKGMSIRNVVNATMTTNAAVPIGVKSATRRYYAVWTELTIRGKNGQITPEWQRYWDDRWDWMRDREGWKACVDYMMTQVDLSDFDPNAIPHVTDYMKSIQEASEDPVSTILKELIDQKRGLLGADLVTAKDVFLTLKTLNLADIPVELKSIPSANTLGKIIKQNGLGYTAKMWTTAQKEIRVWVIRNETKYLGLTGKQICVEYERQHDEIRSGTPLQVVK